MNRDSNPGAMAPSSSVYNCWIFLEMDGELYIESMSNLGFHGGGLLAAHARMFTISRDDALALFSATEIGQVLAWEASNHLSIFAVRRLHPFGNAGGPGPLRYPFLIPALVLTRGPNARDARAPPVIPQHHVCTDSETDAGPRIPRFHAYRGRNAMRDPFYIPRTGNDPPVLPPQLRAFIREVIPRMRVPRYSPNDLPPPYTPSVQLARRRDQEPN